MTDTTKDIDLTPHFDDYDINKLREAIDGAVSSAIMEGSWFAITPHLLKCTELMRKIDGRLT